MTAAFLQSELASLISDSKRKQSDIRSAAEKSLGDLKAINVTSETQLSGDLLRRPHFINPFVLACRSKYPKLAVTGAGCIQRLVANQAVPRGRLADVLDAFRESAAQTAEVQLKVLQALPLLLQLYASVLHGDPLSKILSLCAGLAESKSAIVANTAAATFQQLLSTILEQWSSESSKGNADTEHDASDEAAAANDVAKIFADMCAVVRGHAIKFIVAERLDLRLALGVVETCLANDHSRILKLSECAAQIRQTLIPGMLHVLDSTSSMVIFAQCLRITRLLVLSGFKHFATALTNIFHTVTLWMDRSGGGGNWKRVLCLELMKDLTANFGVLRLLYITYDLGEGKPQIVQTLLASMVRISAENPNLIGLGRQSTMPSESGSEAAAGLPTSVENPEFEAVGSVVQAGANVTGISSQWSTTSAPLLELLERVSSPEIPSTYIYSLVLSLSASISEGMSKFIMPFSLPPRAAVPGATLNATSGKGEADRDPFVVAGHKGLSARTSKHSRLMNPLTRNDLPAIDQIRLCATMIEQCWPAILASCSTFLNAALDSSFYHMLVRTIQKLAQVSGVLELDTPRDALLTTLAKVSVPPNVSSVISLLHSNVPASVEPADPRLEGAELARSPTQATPRPSLDLARHSLNVRNLLCLRALLNLGIALGPTLSESSWFIIIQALQQSEALMSVNPVAKAAGTFSTTKHKELDGDPQPSLASEIAAVGSASKKLIESTATFTNLAFEAYIYSVFKMIDDLVPLPRSLKTEKGHTDVSQQLSPPSSAEPKAHRAARSVSGVLATSSVLRVEVEFVLKSVHEIVKVNLHRFADLESKIYTWDLILTRFFVIARTKTLESSLRLQAASTIDVVAVEVPKLFDKHDLTNDVAKVFENLCLAVLHEQIDLVSRYRPGIPDCIGTDTEIHRRMLEALENLVSRLGDTFSSGWQIVFDILQATMTREAADRNPEASGEGSQDLRRRVLTPAFRTVQLIISDFLPFLDVESLWRLMRLLPLFGTQKDDLNICLTTTALFWDLNSLLLQRVDSFSIPGGADHDVLLTQILREVPTDFEALWLVILVSTTQICRDERSDVRNAAVRVFLRIMEASSSHLEPAMWNFALRQVFVPLLTAYASMAIDDAHWRGSFVNLLQGTISLFRHHPVTIFQSAGFATTWPAILVPLRSMLDQELLLSYEVVFKACSEIVDIMTAANIQDKALLSPILRMWFTYHPASIPSTQDESTEAFASHARVFSAIALCDQRAIEHFPAEDDSLEEQLMRSIQQTILHCRHSKYTNDVNKLSPEQEASLANVKLLQNLPGTTTAKYNKFLVRFVTCALDYNDSTKTEQSGPQDLTESHRRKPTLIKFTQDVIMLLARNAGQQAISTQWMVDYEPSTTLQLLDEMIRTKYTDFPTCKPIPIWQTATEAAVTLVETISRGLSHVEPAHVSLLSKHITSLAQSILDAPHLQHEHSSLSEAQITIDETFDRQHFKRLHQASVKLMRHEAFEHVDLRLYALLLLRSSLIAEPLCGDLPANMLDAPLVDFDQIRDGSIRSTDLRVRQNISRDALECLLNLSLPQASQESSHNSTAMAAAAAPYLLLRIAHAFKTFLADQRLRHLDAPHPDMQKELDVVMTKALELKCDDTAFVHVTKAPLIRDGKTHLRLLYPLVQRLYDFWLQMPRLDIYAWQDGEHGKAVERHLRTWITTISADWAVV